VLIVPPELPVKTVKDFITNLSNEVFNALVVNFALYHFSDEEIKLITEVVLPRCKIVCIQNRSEKRKNRKNSHDFWREKNIISWLEKAGFSCELVWGNEKKSFSEVIAVRKSEATVEVEAPKAEAPVEVEDSEDSEAATETEDA
jgi:hypothetical protein